MTVERISYVLMFTTFAIMLGGLALAMIGASLHSSLFDVGMWIMIASMPVCLASYLTNAWFAVAGWLRS